MLKLFTPLITGLIGTEVSVMAARAKRNAILYAIIICAALIGVIFLLVAAYHALSFSVGPVHAGLLLAAAFFAVAIVAFIINRILESAQKRRQELRRAQIDSNALLTAAALTAVPTVLKRPLLAVALPIIGLVAYELLSRKKPKDK